ncbi:MAG: methyl-accepting chemotaxis protein [Rhizobiaceae bacterium]|nr:methyl-accepting chemotaxis protein [Rhizobiaceae bacterium]
MQMPNDRIGQIANSTTGLGETGETVLLKADGTMITDSQKTAEVEALNVKLGFDQALLDNAQSQSQYGFIEDFRGETYGAALTGLKFGEQNWVVGAMISNREALMGVTMLRYIVLAIAAGLVAVALGAAFLFSRSITKPIAAVVDDMNELVSGNTELELAGAERNDEIGKMFKAVSVFRDAAIEKDRLEEEGEETRAHSEQERRQNEIAKAEDAEKINHVIESLADALKELSVGNLTVQIKSSFEGDLDRVRVDFNNSVAQLRDTL